MSLLEFYGEECPHCQEVSVILRELEKEKGIKIERYEVWHNDDNIPIMEKYDVNSECGGVPFLYNTETKKWICGETKKEDIVKWAMGE